jgi:hypothetical protein
MIEKAVSAITDETTLGDWAAALRPGSPCFCCGGTLRAVTAFVVDLRVASDRGLKCPRCGAEVGGRVIAEVEQAPLTRPEPWLPAAA